MVELTGAFRAEVLRMRRQAGGMPLPVRVTRSQDGTFALEFDQMRESDQALMDTSGSPSSIISRALAAQLNGAILHFRSTGDDRYGDPGVVGPSLPLGYAPS